MIVKDEIIYVKASNGKPIIPTIFTKGTETKASNDEDDETKNEDKFEGGSDGQDDVQEGEIKDYLSR